MKNITTIKLNKEYKRAYFQGKYRAHPFLVTYLVKNHLGCHRIGITTSKKVGKAFARNRARRIVRAAYLQLREEIKFPTGIDIVFVARAQTPSLKTDEVKKVMKKQLLFLFAQLTEFKKKSAEKRKADG